MKVTGVTRAAPELDIDAALLASAATPEFWLAAGFTENDFLAGTSDQLIANRSGQQQIYMRYLGPK